MRSNILLAINNAYLDCSGRIKQELSNYVKLCGAIWREPYEFDHISSVSYHLLRQFSRSDLLDLMVIITIDNGDLFDINIDKARRLIMEFPEVYWVFVFDAEQPEALSEEVRYYHYCAYNVGNPKSQKVYSWQNGGNDSSTEDKALKYLKNRIQWHVNGFRALFDPSGLRTWIRSGKTLIDQGVTVEDELDYSYFNAYLLYSRGMNVFLVRTNAEMKRLWSERNSDRARFTCCIEDMELNFPDVDEELANKAGFRPVNLEELINADRLIRLADVKVVISATSGQCDGEIHIVPKPYQGIYDEHLFKVIKNVNRDSLGSKESSRHHGVPGLDQQIATSLINSCRQMIYAIAPESHSAKYATHAAVLANEARLLLKNKTRMLNLSALELKQQAELIAEANFGGVSTHKVVKHRLNKVEIEVQSLWELHTGDSNKMERQKRIRLSLLRIYEVMKRVFVLYGKFDEERVVSRKISKCHLQLKFPHVERMKSMMEKLKEKFNCSMKFFEIKRKKSIVIKLKRLIDCIVYMVFRYLLMVISSGRALIFWSTVWILMFSAIYFYLNSYPEEIFFTRFVKSLIESMSLFFTLALPSGINHKTDVWWLTVNLLNSIFGVIHIGLFITYLFGILSRK